MECEHKIVNSLSVDIVDNVDIVIKHYWLLVFLSNKVLIVFCG
jgi:hypothetical protein